MMPSTAAILDRLLAAPFVRHAEWHDTIASTNDRGNELARSAEIVTPLLILAGRQTAGRGRGGNQWWSDEGALTFSIVFDPERDVPGCGGHPLSQEQWPKVALAAGVALCDVLQARLPQVPCRLKWPNDVLLAGKKVAGILVEVPPPGNSVPRRLVLGMGVNVNNSLSAAPAEIQAIGAALCDVAGERCDGADLLIDWLGDFAERLRALSAGDDDLVERWQLLCALRGKTIELQSGNRIVRGSCRGIDAAGALLVDTDSGLERLFAGVLVRVAE
ncbi:MAG: biotin--[acetyl-CoA-carboxylase] ligase [Planctomycetia bacterium]|nr:biotin--[acetyl-CoA-carboxylase] ligase [Planctomycetia bacterium]